MFVESFQGQYKDGTNGTRDFRMVSASFPILRMLILGSFMYRHQSTLDTSQLQCVIYVCFSCFHAITKPYKLNFMNNVDILILLLVEILSLATSNPALKFFTYYLLISTLLLGIPHIVLTFHVFAKKAGIAQYLKRKYKALKRCMQSLTHRDQTDVEAESDTGSLPDRLINSGEYEPVLPNTENHTAAGPTEIKELISEDPGKLTAVYTYGSIN